MNPCFADLHLHTVASDGTCSVGEQIARAKACGIRCISITDHDAISEELTVPVQTVSGVEVIAGVEIKADFGDVAGEILAYFIDPKDRPLRAFLDGMEAARIARMEAMVDRCRDVLDIDLHMDEIRAHAQGNIGRPHIARVLVDRGVVEDFSEAFDKLLAGGRPCYVPIEKTRFEEVIRIVHQAGGVTSLAHPCLMKIEDWPPFLDELADAGLDGLETLYQYGGTSKALSIDPHLLASMAVDRGFLQTGGSDDHGPDPASPKTAIGQVRVPYEHVEALKAQASSLNR